MKRSERRVMREQMKSIAGTKSNRTLFHFLRFAHATKRITNLVPDARSDYMSEHPGLTKAATLRIAALPDEDIPAAYLAAKNGGERRGGSRKYDPVKTVQTLHGSIIDVANRLERDDLLLLIRVLEMTTNSIKEFASEQGDQR